jgi:hypothetical protein
MTNEEIEAALARCEAAEGAPLRIGPMTSGGSFNLYDANTGTPTLCVYENARGACEFYAAARTDLPNALRALQAERAKTAALMECSFCDHVYQYGRTADEVESHEAVCRFSPLAEERAKTARLVEVVEDFMSQVNMDYVSMTTVRRLHAAIEALAATDTKEET